MPPHRELNPRFQAHIARARRVRVVSVGLLVTCLLVGTGSALAMLAPQGNGAQAAIKNSLASVADAFDSVGSAFSHVTASISNNLFTSRNQVAAVSSDDSISNRIYRFFCPWFTDCDEPAVEFTTATAPTQPRPQLQPTITVATTTPQNTSTQRPTNVGTGTAQPVQQTVVNNPVIERVIERVVQGAPASLAGYVTQADLLSQIAAVKNSVGTQLYGDWYNNPGSSSNNGGIVGTIGMMGRIDSLSGTELSDITVDGVSGLTDADIPDGITATNYLLLTGGAITGDLSLSGTLTAGSLAVAGVSSGGAIEAPYFTATSTSASSTFPNLNATNSTTTNATSTNMFATLGRFTSAISDAFSAVSATITNLTSTTLIATNATTTRLDAFDYVAIGRTATTTIRGDGVASTIPFASSTAVSVSGTGFFGTASTTNFNLSGTANLQSLAADSLLYNNSSRQLAAATVGNGLSFTGSSLSLNLGNGNTWTGLQQFYGAASSTLFSANWAKFGATASSTFGTDGTLTMGGNIILNGKYLSGDGGNEGIYVDTSGNVGIGTTTPRSLLDVQGASVSAFTGTSNGLLTVRGTGNLQYDALDFSNTNTGQITPGARIAARLTGSGSYLFFGTSNNYASGITNTAMAIDPSGNVGIGTTTPQWPLNIFSSTQSQLSLSAGAGIAQWAFRNAGGNFYLATTTVAGTATSSPSALTIIGSTGNVGVGTTSPYAKLSVVGPVVAEYFHATSTTATSTFAGGLSLGNDMMRAYTSGRLDIGSFSLTSNGLNVFTANSGSVASFQSNGLIAGGTILSIAQGNTVAGGTYGLRATLNNSSGDGEIDIYQSGAGNAVLSAITGSTGDAFARLGINGGPYWSVGLDNSDGDKFKIAGYAPGTDDRLTIDTSGNVGIGTTDPQRTLDVNGIILARVGYTLSTDLDTLIQRGSSGRIVHSAYGTGPTAYDMQYSGTVFTRMSEDSAGNFTIAPQGGATNHLILSPAGNVGIGTTNPNEGKVEVKGGSVCVDTDSNDTATSCIANESDERLKENITSISASSSLDTILALNPVSFDWRASDPEVLSHYPLLGRYAGNTHSIGLIAQQVMPVLPEALSLETVGDAEVQYFQLDYTKFIPHLIGAVKELWAKVQDLGQKVAALFESVEEQNAKIQALEARVNQLEAQTGAAAAPSGGGANTPAPEPEPDPIPEGEAEEETDSPATPSDEPAAEIQPPSENPESESAEEIEESDTESTPESTVEPEPIIENPESTDTSASE